MRSRLLEGYQGGDMPLGGYATLLATYFTVFGGVGALLARRGRVRRLSPGELALVGVATHKLTRIVTRDWVTIPLRAPFTRFVASSGSGEVDEKSRGTGLRKAIGDLLTCNYCTGPWIAGALVASMSFAPRATRTVSSVFAAVTLSDFLHELYENLRATRKLETAESSRLEDRADGDATAHPGMT